MQPHAVLLVAVALPAVRAGLSATISSNDVASGPALGNVKAVWDADLTIAGSKSKLSLLLSTALTSEPTSVGSPSAVPVPCDMKAKKDFIKEAKLAGALADVKYTLTHAIGKGLTGLTLTSKQAGHVLKAAGDSASMVTSVSAKGSASLGGFELDYEPAYMLKKKLSKLTLSAALGGGVSATGVVTATSAGEMGSDYELGYDASLGEGRALSATVRPTDKAGAIEVTDTATEPGATWVAAMSLALGSKPGLTLRRSIKL